MVNKQQIRKLVWDMACSTSENGKLFNTWEYSALFCMGFNIGQYRSEEDKWFLSDQPPEVATMFALFIYHSLS